MNGHRKLFKTQAIKPTLGSKQSDWQTLENSTNTSTKSNVSVSKKKKYKKTPIPTKKSKKTKRVSKFKGIKLKNSNFSLFYPKKKVNPDKTQQSQTTQMAKFQPEIRINWNQIKTLF